MQTILKKWLNHTKTQKSHVWSAFKSYIVINFMDIIKLIICMEILAVKYEWNFVNWFFTHQTFTRSK